MSRDDEEDRRAAARKQRRVAGDRSARVASQLMKLKDAALAKLQLDDEMREEVVRARAITSPIARRRAERALAGQLRRVDIGEIEQAIENLEAGRVDDARLFHQAEQWRAKMIEGGIAAAETFPGGAAAPLPELIERAQRERDTGKPPGAARALFRHVLQVLQRGA